MKANAKAARLLQKNLEMLKAKGIELDLGGATPKELAGTRKNSTQSQSHAVDALLRSIRRPGDFTYRNCKRCNEVFGSDYAAVAYCSDNCRSKQFTADTGLVYNAQGRTELERWGGEPPSIITPEIMRTMLPFAKKILASVCSADPEVLALLEQAPDIPQPKPPAPVVHTSPTIPSAIPEQAHTETTTFLDMLAPVKDFQL